MVGDLRRNTFSTIGIFKKFSRLESRGTFASGPLSINALFCQKSYLENRECRTKPMGSVRHFNFTEARTSYIKHRTLLSRFFRFYEQLEPISVDIHDFDLWVFAQIFTQFCNENVHRTRRKIGIFLPNFG
jgi:hypothetical protein